MAHMMRAVAISLSAGIALAAPAHAHAQAPVQPARAPAIYTLPFELYDGRIYIQVSGAGFDARTFLVDTGAQVTHFTTELVREAGLRTRGSIGISGVGPGRIQGTYVGAILLKVGGAPLQVKRAIAAPGDALFGPVYTGSGKRFEGVIGYDLFAAYGVEIDYERRQIRLYERDGYELPAGADIVPIRLVDKKPYLTGIVGLGGRSIPANLHLDTGSGGGIGFTGKFVEEQGLMTLAAPTLPSYNRGVGGTTPARLGRAETLMLGTTVLNAPFVTMALAQGRGVRSDSAGRIGGAILRRFTVAIDYADRVIGLVPNGIFGQPIETDMSGLALVSGDGGVVLVSSVAEASPALEAGFLEGDRLISIDGRAVSSMTLEEIRGLLMKHGDTRSLVILRQNQELAISLTLRRRI